MKKIVLAVLAVGLLVSACSTSVPIKENREIEPFAIITINSNKEMAWEDEPAEKSTGGLILGIVKGIAASQNDKVSNMIFDGTEDLLALGRETIISELAKSGRPVIEENAVLTSKAYKIADDSRNDFPNYITAPGYKYIVNHGSDFHGMMQSELGVNGSITITFDFRKTMLYGAMDSGELGAYVFLNVMILDSKGTNVYYDSFYAESEEGVPVLARIYDPEDLHRLFPPLIKQVCREFTSKL